MKKVAVLQKSLKSHFYNLIFVETLTSAPADTRARSMTHEREHSVRSPPWSPRERRLNRMRPPRPRPGTLESLLLHPEATTLASPQCLHPGSLWPEAYSSWYHRALGMSAGLQEAWFASDFKKNKIWELFHEQASPETSLLILNFKTIMWHFNIWQREMNSRSFQTA
jgi:hypothetical protein